MKFKFRYLLIGLGLILVLAVGGFVVWTQDALGPGEQALTALEAEGDVVVTVGEDTIVFMPVGVEPHTGFVFYPGGRVDYRSYARPLRQVASRGFLVISVRAPLNLMVFAPDKGDKIIPQYPDITHWAVGGHSLGGAMAAQYAGNHLDTVDGLVLWASYPASNNDLSASGLQVLSVYGTKDMAGMEPFDDSRVLLPADTIWAVLQGGNHAQFGDYGVQSGDNPPEIRDYRQQALTVAATVDFLESLGK